MLTIWLLQTGEPLHIDKGNPRPMRAMNLANYLISKGHKVVIWSSNFYHQEKKHRASDLKPIVLSDQLEIRLIPSPGYQRNIGFARLWDHLVLAYKLKKMLSREHSMPDVAFIGYPPIETAYILVRWLSRRGIPTLLDLKDQWPSLFLEPLPRVCRPLGRLLLWPYFYCAKITMAQATGLSAMAEDFLGWGLGVAGRARGNNDDVFPLTAPTDEVHPGALETARKWWDQQGVLMGDDIVRLTFVGSHMSVFDFEPIRDAAILLNKHGVKSQFVICGDGGYSKQIRLMMAGISNVIFPGWVDRAQIQILAERSQAALTPYKNIDNFKSNLPNKVIDSLSLGLPILSPLQGEVAKLISENNVGYCYGSIFGKSLFECIEDMRGNELLRRKMRENALSLFQKKYSFETVYSSLARHLEVLAQKGIGDIKNLCQKQG